MSKKKLFFLWLIYQREQHKADWSTQGGREEDLGDTAVFRVDEA